MGDTTLRLSDADGQAVPAGAIGELWAHGTAISSGYYKRPDATADVFTADAWLRLRLGTLFPATLPRLDLTLEAAQVAGGNTSVHLSASAARLGAVLRREPPFQLVLGVRAGD